MGLSLRGSTSGAIDINPPAIAGDNAITLPASNGSANQFFKNSGTAGIVTYSSMVETSDKVGIGTLTPDTILSLHGTLGTEKLITLSTGSSKRNNYIGVESSDNLAIGADEDGEGNDSSIRFRVDGSERLRIASTGHVAIGGYGDPGSILDVRENKVEAETQIRLFNTDNGDTTLQTAALYLSPDSRATAASGLRSIKENANMSTSAARDVSLTLNTLQNNSQVEAIRIKSDGKVGIGTDNALSGLDVTQSEGRFRVNKFSHLLLQNTNNSITDYWGICARNGGELDFSYGTPDGDGVVSTDKFTILSSGKLQAAGGISLGGETDGAHTLQDYEEGTITAYRLVKSDGNSAGSNHSDTEVQYTKIGNCVYICGHIRTDGTQSSKTGNLRLVSTTDGATAQNLPFVPNHKGAIPILHTRSCSTADTTYSLSLGFVNGSAEIYVYSNDSTGDYIIDSNTLDCNTQTNLVITFSGHYFTDS